jgi:Skp family chaperone for outer membrane proteins
MKFRLLAAAAVAATSLAAVPAAAQVSGIGIAEPALAIARSQAFAAAYQQIGTTFQAQRTQLEQQEQQRSNLARQFDANGDGQLNQQELETARANAAVVQQLETLEQQIAQTRAPMTAAQIYVVEQLAMQLSPAVEQVVQTTNVQMVLTPAVVLWAAPAADLTDEITAVINQRAPTVSTAVPQGWQPQPQSLNLFEQVEELLLRSALQQAAQQQAQQPAATQPAPGR